MAAEHDIEPEQRLSNPAQIAGILKRLNEARSLLSVSFPKSADLFNSAVLSVDPVEGCFTLDEINPRRGHEQVSVGLELRMEGSLQGIDTRFLVTIDEVLLESGIYYYRARLPEYLIYRQRRQFHRVPVRRTLQARISLTGDNSTVTDVRLTDLSAGGFGGVVIKGSPLVQGSRHDCALQLPDQAELRVPVDVRFAKIDASGQQHFGAMFTQMSPLDRRRIARTVMDLERELRRVT